MANEKSVKLVGILQHPTDEFWDTQDYSYCGAKGCFDERSSAEIHDSEVFQERMIQENIKGILDSAVSPKVILNKTDSSIKREHEECTSSFDLNCIWFKPYSFFCHNLFV